jgi:hypothetical protein
MSHLNSFKTDITDRDALVRALCRMGFTRNQIEVHDKAQPILGFHGTQDRKVGHIIIRKGNTNISSDIGWEKQGETFVGHVDSYWGIYTDDWHVQLMDGYNTEVKKAELEAKGFVVVEDRDEQNRIRLRAKFTTKNKTSRIQTRS